VAVIAARTFAALTNSVTGQRFYWNVPPALQLSPQFSPASTGNSSYASGFQSVILLPTAVRDTIADEARIIITKVISWANNENKNSLKQLFEG
jgi:hypothetical protein